MSQNYNRMAAVALCEEYIKIIQLDCSDPRLSKIRRALSARDIQIEFPPEEIKYQNLDKDKNRLCYISILFVKNGCMVKEATNILIKVPLKTKLLAAKKLTPEDIKFLKEIKVIPWD